MKQITMDEFREAGDFRELIDRRRKYGENFPFEIEESIFDHFLESVPPLKLSEEMKERMKYLDIRPDTITDIYGKLQVNGFLNSEPVDIKAGFPVYNLFFVSGNKFYYGGLSKR